MKFFRKRPPRKLKVEYYDLSHHLHKGNDPTLWPNDTMNVVDPCTGQIMFRVKLVTGELLRIEQMLPVMTFDQEIIDWAARQGPSYK